MSVNNNEISGKSLDIKNNRLEQLKQILPEVFTEGKIDFDRLKLTLGAEINTNQERYHLNWAGKSEAFRVLQTPTIKTLAPAKEESVNFDETNHIFIEGENLEVLKVLQKSYFGKIKMIYIDPPYNTGNDSFIYPDKFSESKESYQKRVGDKDDEGYMTREGLFHKNSKENGQYHSNWLNMMYPRLFLSRNLLREDGVIFISIDDNEVHNLRMLMNEIFGEENFVANVIWEKKYTRSNDAIFFSDNHDHILIFTRNKDFFKLNLLPRNEEQESAYTNPDNHSKGPWKATPLQAKSGNNTTFIYTFKNGVTWSPPTGTYPRFSIETLARLDANNEIYFGSDGKATPSRKTFLSEAKAGVTPTTIWSYNEVGHNHEANNELKTLNLGGLFDNPKPTRLIKRILELSTLSESNDIILDFFSGSATTAHAVLALNKEDASTGSPQAGNRKFICVQMPEACDEKSEAFKAGYNTIADIGKERIRRVIEKIQKEDEGKLGLEEKNIDLGFKVLKLTDSNFKVWRESEITNEDELKTQMIDFTDPVSPSAAIENMVYELLLKAGFDLNAIIEKKKNFYVINQNELLFLLEKADQKIIDEVIALKPQKVIALDKLFEKNDKLKTNTVLQMKDAGIEFKSI
jgi:adenine-specific DNA-methyltransferase